VIEVTDWAADILNRAQQAARRFEPDVSIRLIRTGGGIEATLAEGPEPADQQVQVGDMTLYVEKGLEGLLDIEEPHDRLVLRPPGSTPHVRAEH
jgi:hypothetical protein